MADRNFVITTVGRRTLLWGIAAELSKPTFAVAGTAPEAVVNLGQIERRHGGRLGVFALDTSDGRTLAHRADERFLLQSTFKGFLAAMVLRRVADGRDRLDEELRYGRADLLPASPVTEAAVAAGRLSIERLCAAILERSDNAAANLLLRYVGGPSALTAYVRGLNDMVTRFDRYELIGARDGDKDTSTPRAVVGTARAMLLGDALPTPERMRLEGWMANNSPGRNRLRAAFPKNWEACDRTGTSDGVCNDYALARRPGRGELMIAAYYEAAGMELPAQEAVLREVGLAVVAWAD